ncbi:unnamed protein product [Rhizophagus irregularis]|nr:unnamed protein product [Rhizophagus irregularis]CAB4441675.1 unnamed protein product [Rhizophagus irregularis]
MIHCPKGIKLNQFLNQTGHLDLHDNDTICSHDSLTIDSRTPPLPSSSREGSINTSLRTSNDHHVRSHVRIQPLGSSQSDCCPDLGNLSFTQQNMTYYCLTLNYIRKFCGKKRKNRNNNASYLRGQALRSEIRSDHHRRRMIYAHCFICSCRQRIRDSLRISQAPNFIFLFEQA